MISQDTYRSLIEKLAARTVSLVAVSKGRTPAQIKTLYDWGQRDFGENYVQELLPKYEQLSKDIRWHFIGHLQTNKVKYIAPFVAMIQSVDSQKLLQEINKQAEKNNRTVDYLLEVKIVPEGTKTGMNIDQTREMIQSNKTKNLNNTRIRGLMGIASNVQDQEVIRPEFETLRDLFLDAKSRISTSDDFSTLSMGMSNDYQIAVDVGSTMVRIGTLLFAD